MHLSASKASTKNPAISQSWTIGNTAEYIEKAEYITKYSMIKLAVVFIRLALLNIAPTISFKS